MLYVLQFIGHRFEVHTWFHVVCAAIHMLVVLGCNCSITGPVVIEVPPRCGPSTVNDAFFRFVTDMGGPGYVCCFGF